jgi:hypothetical protein
MIRVFDDSKGDSTRVLRTKKGGIRAVSSFYAD